MFLSQAILWIVDLHYVSARLSGGRRLLLPQVWAFHRKGKSKRYTFYHVEADIAAARSSEGGITLLCKDLCAQPTAELRA